MIEGYVEANRTKPCPICGALHRNQGWCLLAKDGSHVICPRVESARRAGDAGWVHELGAAPSGPRAYRKLDRQVSRSGVNYGIRARLYESELDPKTLRDAARSLGVFTGSLRGLGMGYDGEALTFPMYDAAGEVIGIRRRLPDGRKLSVKGGHEGCFVPRGMIGDQTTQIVVCEGPTDTAAALDIGLPAIGRPSCTGGTRIVEEITRGRDVVIVSDNDGPGMEGARRLAELLADGRRLVRFVLPVEGKDMRSWHPSAPVFDAVAANALIVSRKVDDEQEKKEGAGRAYGVPRRRTYHPL